MSVYVSAWCWKHSKSKGVDRLILISIADMADDDGENAFPSDLTLAGRCGGISIKTVQRSTQRLEDLGELAIALHGGLAREGRTNQRSNRYSFPAYQAHEKCGQSDLSSDRPPGGARTSPAEARTSEAGSQDISGERPDTAVSADPSFDPSSFDQTTSANAAASSPALTTEPAADDEASTPGTVEAGVSDHKLQPQGHSPVPTVGVPALTPRGDDLGGGADVVDLFGGATKPAKPRGRTPKPDTTVRDLNARDVVAAWAEAYLAATGVKPTGNRCGQLGKEAKQLLGSGNDVRRLVDAAREAGRLGWWSVERQMTAVARATAWNKPKPGGVAGFTNPVDQSVYDVPL